MKKLLFILLLIPSLVFSQARIRNNPLFATDTILLVDSSVVNALKAGKSFPLELKLRHQGTNLWEEVTATANLGNIGAFTKIKITRDIDGNIEERIFPENDNADLFDSRLIVSGTPTATSNIQTTTAGISYSQLPSALTGSQNVGNITGTVNVPMSQHLYEGTVTGNTTLTASNGVAGQIVYLVFVTSGTVSRTVTFGTGFRGTALATGTVTAKHFACEFVWNDIDSIWDEVGTPVAR